MDDALVLDLCRQAFSTALLVSGPVLAVVLAIGVAVSILQAITQVQEATLAFVPKMLGAGLVMLLGGYWMLEQLLHLTRGLLGDFGPYTH
ncbi:MAG: flagellar biosynthetic protein FliQ [Armatimonadetes bacterium]|nr:flagellar biosynthetic protein FliQ [Armatimonadota bacterium]